MIVELPEGERKRIKNFLGAYQKQVVKIVAADALWVATFLRVKLVQRLWNQDFRHKPLSRPYALWKKRTGKDPRILIATYAYIDSIQVQENVAISGANKGQIVSYAVRCREGFHPPSGLRYIDIARIHEFGSRRAKIPARPHWRPVWNTFLKESRHMFQKKITESFAGGKKR